MKKTEVDALLRDIATAIWHIGKCTMDSCEIDTPVEYITSLIRNKHLQLSTKDIGGLYNIISKLYEYKATNERLSKQYYESYHSDKFMIDWCAPNEQNKFSCSYNTLEESVMDDLMDVVSRICSKLGYCIYKKYNSDGENIIFVKVDRSYDVVIH